MSSGRTLVFVALGTLSISAQPPQVPSTERVPVVPRPATDPCERVRDVRAELERIRQVMAKLEQQSRVLAEELRTLEREQTGTGLLSTDKLSPEERAKLRLHGRGQTAAGPPSTGRLSPYDRAKPWIEGMLQINDPYRRAMAVDAVRGALVGGDPDASHAALLALCQAAQAQFDKKPFREFVLPWTEHPDPALRCQAFYALFNTAREPGDLDRVLAQVDDPRHEIRGSIVHLLCLFSDRDLTGRAGEAVLGLIATGTRKKLRSLLPDLWGARVSPAIAERLLELSRDKDPELAHDAIYFGLSTLEDKSEPVVGRLIELLADAGENGGRALWGLGHGVPAPLQPKVATAMLRLVAARSASQLQQSALRIVGMCGTSEHLPELERIASNELASEALRKQARDAADRIAKQGRNR